MLLAGGSLAGLVLLAGCADDAPQDTWHPAGPNAQKIDNLQKPVFLIAGIVGVIVFAVVGYCIFKYRDRGQDIPEQTHGKPWLEILLTIIPAVILLFVGVFTVSTVFALAKTSDTQCIINVTGQQWWWEYDYPVQDGCMPGGIDTPIVTSGELVIPTQTRILLHVTSRDVIHSFWIPKLNGKRDAVPGRDQTLRMEADQPGMYLGQCTEFCGLSHARMRMAAVGLNSADFATWAENQVAAYTPPDPGTLAATGQATFVAQCSRCHQVNGLTVDVGGVSTPVLSNPDQYEIAGAAPNLTNLMTRTHLRRGDVRPDDPGVPGQAAERLTGGVRSVVPAGGHARLLRRGQPALLDPQRAGDETDVRVRGGRGDRRWQVPWHARPEPHRDHRSMSSSPTCSCGSKEHPA